MMMDADRESRMTQARRHIDQQQYANAKQILERLCAEQPSDPQAWFFLGGVHGQLGEMDAAIECCGKVIALRPNHADAWYNLGQAYLHRGNSEAAAAAYAKATALRPDFVDAYFNLGCVLSTRGEHTRALETFAQTVKINPNYGAGWCLMAGISNWLHAYDDALNFSARAIQLNAADAKAHMHRGTALKHRGEERQAIDAYRTALALDPTLETVRYFLSVMHAEPVPNKAPREYVTQVFDSYAASFDEHLVEGLNYRVPSVMREMVDLTRGDTDARWDVIDLGCGTGLCGVAFRPIAKSILGIDLSTAMLEKAREKNVYEALRQVDVESPDMAPPASVDLIVAGDLFIYVGDVDPVFKNAGRMLKPNGLLVFSVEDEPDDSMAYVLRVTGRYAQSHRYLAAMATRYGFDPIMRRQIRLRMDGPSAIQGSVYILRRAKEP